MGRKETTTTTISTFWIWFNQRHIWLGQIEREQQQRGRERERNVDENSKIFSKNKCRKYLLLVSVVVVAVVVVKQHMVACVRKTLKESFGCESFREASFFFRASKREDCLLATGQVRKLEFCSSWGLFFCVPGGGSSGPQTTTVKPEQQHVPTLTGKGCRLRIRHVAEEPVGRTALNWL